MTESADIAASIDPRAEAANSRSNGDESKRDRIIRLAGELFLEHGYDNVSINDIIEVAGGSKGTIYFNFGSKEKLFEAVIERMCSDVTLKIDIRSTGALEDQLRRLAHSFVDIVLTERILKFHRLITFVGRSFPDAGRLFYDTGPRTACGIIASWISLQQERGLIRRDCDPFRLASLFHDMLIGDAMMRWLTSAGNDDEREKRVDETVELAVRVFLQGAAVQR